MIQFLYVHVCTFAVVINQKVNKTETYSHIFRPKMKQVKYIQVFFEYVISVVWVYLS